MNKKANKAILILIIIVLLFFVFWKINEFPQDVNGEVIMMVNALRCLEWAHNENSAPQICFQKLYNQWETQGVSARNYEEAAFVHKLWLLMLAVILHIFGYSIFSITLASCLLSAITIFFTYKLGKLLYSHETGILAAIFLGTGIAYNMVVRSGYGFIVIATISVAVYYYIARYLDSRRNSDLIIAGILLGIGSLDSPPQFFLIPIVAVVTLLLDFSQEKKSKLKMLSKNLKNITTLLIWALVTSLILTLLYAWCYKTTLYSIFESVYLWISQRLHGAQYTHQYLSIGVIDSLKYAVIFIKNIFVSMSFVGESIFGLDDYALMQEKIPMVTPLISLAFIFGLLSILRKRRKADGLILTWIGINFILFMFIIMVQTRYVVIFLPVICIVAAYGVSRIINRINLSRYPGVIRQVLYAICILFVSYVGYKDFFILYKNNDANLRRFYNNSKIADFILKNANPQDCLVILDETLFCNRDAIRFSMGYKPYQILYLEEVLYKKAQGSLKREISFKQSIEIIKNLESQALAANKTILYIFSEHDVDYYLPAMVPPERYSNVSQLKNTFLTLHPDSKPIEILRYSNGDQTHSIFVVKK